MSGCKRCGGKGWINSPVQLGACFLCDGLGDEQEAKRIRKEEKIKANNRWIKELKESIALTYTILSKPKVLGGETRKAQLRKEAAEKNKILKEKFGIVLTLEEIKEIAKEF